MGSVTDELTAIPAKERAQIAALDRILHAGQPMMVDAKGNRTGLTPTVYALLRRAVEMLAEGKTVRLVPDETALTTQRAAEMLGMSRPHFVKLIEAGAMAHHRVGNQRRVYLRDVQGFAVKREVERQAALDEMSRQAFAAGLYDRNEVVRGGRRT
jgi:excisionase family DNA binding protein